MRTALLMTAVLVCLVFALPAAAQPPVPQVVLENSSVRVTILTFPPGGGTGRHQGVEAEVGIAVDGDLTLESPQGRTVVRAGTAYWMPGLTPHDVRNESGRPVKMFDVLLKRCD